MKVTIYHNPRCSKSRAALTLLEAHGIQPDVVLYLDTPPAPETLKRILALLQYTPRELMRRGEAPYKELSLDDPALTGEQLIDAMSRHPVLIERPIVIVEDHGEEHAVVGRPPENILTLLP